MQEPLPPPPVLLEKISSAPQQSGVYLFFNRRRQVVYVGKAKNLRTRVKNYFHLGGDGRAMIPYLVDEVDDLEFLVTANEKEALILENTLIKKHQPRYNVLFRDDKDFLHLRMTLSHRFPRISVVRRPKVDGEFYFGPHSSARSIRRTITLLQKVFQLRPCSDQTLKSRTRPCLFYQLQQCSAPCVNRIDEKAYRKLVDMALSFLKGSSAAVLESLEESMQSAAGELQFEQAAIYRDRIKAIRHVMQRQQAETGGNVDCDIWGWHRQGSAFLIQILFMRSGKMTDSRSFLWPRIAEEELQFAADFLFNFYAGSRSLPGEILLPKAIPGQQILEDSLCAVMNRKVKLFMPQRGEKRRLVEQAMKNAIYSLQVRLGKEAEKAHLLEEFQIRFGLPKIPKIIDCIDISTLQGEETVASCVRFRRADSSRSDYRRFRIRSFSGQDDYAAMREVVERRLRRCMEEETLADLLLVDGGPGQLREAIAVRDRLGLSKTLTLFAIAKVRSDGRRRGKDRHSERIWRHPQEEPMTLSAPDSVLLFIQRIRDEAHRFAIEFHRARRDRKRVTSRLLRIPGIGPQRRKRLMRHFRSIDALSRAEPAKVAKVGGFSLPLANKLVAQLAADRQQKEAGGSP